MSGSFGGWILKSSPIPITKKPDLNDPVLRAKLAKGMGHNYYGEPAWPNDLLYIFPVVIPRIKVLLERKKTMASSSVYFISSSFRPEGLRGDSVADIAINFLEDKHRKSGSKIKIMNLRASVSIIPFTILSKKNKYQKYFILKRIKQSFILCRLFVPV